MDSLFLCTLYPKRGVFVLPGEPQNIVTDVGPTSAFSLRLGRLGPRENTQHYINNTIPVFKKMRVGAKRMWVE